MFSEHGTVRRNIAILYQNGSCELFWGRSCHTGNGRLLMTVNIHHNDAKGDFVFCSVDGSAKNTDRVLLLTKTQHIVKEKSTTLSPTFLNTQRGSTITNNTAEQVVYILLISAFVTLVLVIIVIAASVRISRDRKKRKEIFVYHDEN